MFTATVATLAVLAQEDGLSSPILNLTIQVDAIAGAIVGLLVYWIGLKWLNKGAPGGVTGAWAHVFGPACALVFGFNAFPHLIRLSGELAQALLGDLHLI